MALGEKLNIAYGLFGGHIRIRNVEGWDTEARRQVAISALVLAATPYLWPTEISAIVAASPLPTHVVSPELLSVPLMFWSEEVEYEAIVSGAVVGHTNWTLLARGDHDQLFIFHDITRAGEVEVVAGAVKYGSRFPDDFEPENRAAQVRWLQRLAFLRSPFVETTSTLVPRQWRKELQRSGTPEDEAERPINVIVLRRSAARSVKDETADRAVEWKHQWWVSGHYRAQWYPSKQAHEVIWIAPYLKGPEGAPPTERVFTVRR